MIGTVQTICGTVVALALVGAVAVLVWHGSVDGQAAMAFFGALAGGGAAAGIGHVATKTGAKAARNQLESDPPK